LMAIVTGAWQKDLAPILFLLFPMKSLMYF
jgi:hypothetical protein